MDQLSVGSRKTAAERSAHPAWYMSRGGARAASRAGSRQGGGCQGRRAGEKKSQSVDVESALRRRKELTSISRARQLFLDLLVHCLRVVVPSLSFSGFSSRPAGAASSLGGIHTSPLSHLTVFFSSPPLASLLFLPARPPLPFLTGLSKSSVSPGPRICFSGLVVSSSSSSSSLSRFACACEAAHELPLFLNDASGEVGLISPVFRTTTFSSAQK